MFSVAAQHSLPEEKLCNCFTGNVILLNCANRKKMMPWCVIGAVLTIKPVKPVFAWFDFSYAPTVGHVETDSGNADQSFHEDVSIQ